MSPDTETNKQSECQEAKAETQQRAHINKFHLNRIPERSRLHRQHTGSHWDQEKEGKELTSKGQEDMASPFPSSTLNCHT